MGSNTGGAQDFEGFGGLRSLGASEKTFALQKIDPCSGAPLDEPTTLPCYIEYAGTWVDMRQGLVSKPGTAARDVANRALDAFTSRLRAAYITKTAEGFAEDVRSTFGRTVSAEPFRRILEAGREVTARDVRRIVFPEIAWPDEVDDGDD